MSPVDKRLALALAASFVAHWLFVAFAPIEPPDTEEDTVLTARIEYMPPPPAANAPPAPRAESAAPKPKPKPKPKPVPPNTTVAALNPPPQPVVEVPLPEPEPEPKKKEEEEEAAKKVAETAQPEPRAEPVVEPTPVAPPQTPAFASSYVPNAPTTKAAQHLAALPRVIDLTYKAGYAQGENYPMPIGGIKLRFQHEGDKYELKTVGQASGFFKMLYPGVLKMRSVGTLGEQGIRPNEFEMNRERQGAETRTRKVIFDHEKKLIRINDKEPVPLEGQAFDVLTFVVQFYFAMPEGNEVTLQVVSPSRVDSYHLKRGEKETIDTPQGKIETEVWRGSRKAAGGSAEFWLAPSWHYIPFRVRMTDERDRKASLDLEAVAVEASSLAAASGDGSRQLSIAPTASPNANGTGRRPVPNVPSSSASTAPVAVTPSTAPENKY